MRLEWTAPAQADLTTIIEYIAQDDPQAAHQLVDGIVDSTENTLMEHPNAGRAGRIDGTQEWVAHKHYVVVYRLTNTQKIQVLAVVHSARLWPASF